MGAGKSDPGPRVVISSVMKGCADLRGAAAKAGRSDHLLLGLLREGRVFTYVDGSHRVSATPAHHSRMYRLVVACGSQQNPENRGSRRGATYRMNFRSPALLVPLAVAASLLAVFLLWPVETVREPDAGREAAQEERVLRGDPPSMVRESFEPDGSSGPEVESGPPGRSYVPPIGSATLVGRVVDDAGHPLAEATVSAALQGHQFSIERNALVKYASAAASVQSDGSFRLTGLEPAEAYLLHAAQAGFQPATSAPFEPGPGQTLDVGELVLKRLCQVAGRVQDSAGHPIAGATVEPYHNRSAHHTTTDADGRFLLDQVAPGAQTICAEATGFVGVNAFPNSPAKGMASVRLAPGERRDGLLIELEPEGVIRGRILGPDGALLVEEPFAISARASEKTGGGSFTVNRCEAVSEDGAFLLSRLDPARSYDLVARGLSGRTQVRANVPCGSEDLVFEFERLPMVRVAVRSQADGTPLLPERVVLRRDGDVVCDLDTRSWREGRTDEVPPLLTLPYRQAGAHELSVSKRGYLTAGPMPLELDGQASIGPFAVLLQKEPRDEPEVTGTVLRSGSRTPLANVKVTLMGRSDDEDGFAKLRGVIVTDWSSHRPRHPTTRTDQDGRFSFAKGYPPLSLVLNDDRFVAECLDRPRGASLLNLEILAREAGAVEGQVVLVNGEPAAGMPIVADRSDAGPRITTTDENGSYQLGPLLPGIWELSVGNPHAKEREKYRPDAAASDAAAARKLAVEVIVPEGRFVTRDIDLRQLGAALFGTVTVNGLPRTDLGVRLTPVGSDSGSPLSYHTAWTGSSGGYAFPCLQPGRYVSEIRASRGNTVLAESRLSLTLGQELQHDFDIRLGKLKVTVVTQETGEPMESVQVWAVPSSGPGWERGVSRVLAKTKADGLAVLFGLTAGEHAVVIDSDRGAVTRRVTLPPGGVLSLTVQLAQPVRWSITLQGADIEGLSRVSLSLYMEGQRVSSHTFMGPLASPKLELAGIQPATYDLRVTAPSSPPGANRLEASGRFEVRAGVENAATLTLENVEPADRGE